MEIRKIFKSGGSLVVALPQNMREYLDLQEGDQVLLRFSDEFEIVIAKIRPEMLAIVEEKTKEERYEGEGTIL